MEPRPTAAVFTRTLRLCVGLTFLIHVGTYLLNTQLPLHVVGLGGSHAQIGWLFAVSTGVAMLLRPQVGGWVDRFGARAVMLPGAGVMVVTMLALAAATRPLAVIAGMAGTGSATRSSRPRAASSWPPRARPGGGARPSACTTWRPPSAWRSVRRSASRWSTWAAWR